MRHRYYWSLADLDLCRLFLSLKRDRSIEAKLEACGLYILQQVPPQSNFQPLAKMLVARTNQLHLLHTV